MKKNMKNLRYGILSSLITVIIFGCATTAPKSDNQLANLEKEILQLKAENTNLSSRTKNLDDKLMVLEKKKSVKNDQIRKKRLKTVKLSPGKSATSPRVASDSISFAQMANTKSNVKRDVNNSKRPVLTLYDGGDYSTSTSTKRSTANSNNSYRDIASVNMGDNLGVVKKGQIVAGENMMDPMAIFNSAYRAYTNGEYKSALAGFSGFLKKESNHSYADNAMFWRGECYLAIGNMMKAIGEFERLIKRYPGSEKASSSLYRLGYVYDQLSDKPRAKEYYFKVVDKYPGTDAARKASRRMSGNVSLVRTSGKRQGL